MPVFPRPEGHHTLTPACIVHNAAKVIAFLENAFGGKVVDRYEGPGGSVMHAEVMVSGSVLMLGEPQPGSEAMPIAISYYVDDADAVDTAYTRALAAGATMVSAPENQFYGYRAGTVKDAGGNRWTICAVIEQLTQAQTHQRMAEMRMG